MNMPSDSDLKSIGEVVAEMAYSIFNECGQPDDFCCQNVSLNGIVFGGYNRLLYHPLRGWSIDEPYCRPSFIVKWRLVKQWIDNGTFWSNIGN